MHGWNEHVLVGLRAMELEIVEELLWVLFVVVDTPQ